MLSIYNTSVRPLLNNFGEVWGRKKEKNKQISSRWQFQDRKQILVGVSLQKVLRIHDLETENLSQEEHLRTRMLKWLYFLKLSPAFSTWQLYWDALSEFVIPGILTSAETVLGSLSTTHIFYNNESGLSPWESIFIWSHTQQHFCKLCYH